MIQPIEINPNEPMDAMKRFNSQCLIISDYPIKLITYRQLLVRLGVNHIESMDWIPDEGEKTFENVDLLVVDMNLPSDEESDYFESLKKSFPDAQILMLQEDHDSMVVEIDQGRKVCQMGKLSDLEMTKALITSLLDWCKPNTQSHPSTKRKCANE